jgi:hypothetical protein
MMIGEPSPRAIPRWSRFAYERGELTRIDRLRALFYVGAITRRETACLGEKLRERRLERRSIEPATTCVVALRDSPERVGHREAHPGACRLAAERAAQTAPSEPRSPAEQLAAELLQILRGESDAERRDEIPRVIAVELVSVRLADAVNHPHLQRYDRHRRQTLR